MKAVNQPRDFFSRFVNWFSNSHPDGVLVDSKMGGKDFFSRWMNRISE